MRYALYLFSLVLLFGSCSKGGNQVFDLVIERDFDIPNNLNTIETHFFQLKNIPTRIDENLKLYGMTKDDVGEVAPGDSYISSTFSTIDWSFVREVEVYVISRLDGTKSQVFYVRQPDYINRDQVGLFNTFADAAEILKEESIDIEVRIRIQQFVPGNINAKLIMSFGVFGIS